MASLRSTLVSIVVAVTACTSADPSSPGTGGTSGTGGTVGSGGTTGTGGAQTGGSSGTGGSGNLGSGGAGPSGSGGSTGSEGTGGVAGASGSTGTGGGGQAGQAGTGSGDAGPGGSAGSGGVGGRGGTSGTGGSAGSGGSGTPMRSAGCGKTPTLTSGSRTIQSGQSRSYILRIPENYDNNQPYRLIFAYHWRGGTMQDIDGGGTSGAAWSYYGLRAQANNSTIFVAPQGIGNGWPNSGGADLRLTDDLVKLIQDDLCVDTTRVFALGFSYGGGMSYAIACARPTVFRAVAVYAGALLSGCEGGTQPIAYLGIHGISDGTLNISGGRMLRDRFVRNNGCTSQSPPEPSRGSGMHTCTTYQGCMAGYPVAWCAFDGGHTPGHVDGGGDDGARTWTKTETWKFFSQF